MNYKIIASDLDGTLLYDVAAVSEENYRAMTKGIVIPGKENNPELEDEEGGYKSTELEDY